MNVVKRAPLQTVGFMPGVDQTHVNRASAGFPQIRPCGTSYEQRGPTCGVQLPVVQVLFEPNLQGNVLSPRKSDMAGWAFLPRSGE